MIVEGRFILAGAFFAVMGECYLFFDKWSFITNTHAKFFYIW